MNWYKESKKKWNKLDTNLLCCGYPRNRRKNPYKPNKKASLDTEIDKKLIIVRGIPGSGKSTLAKSFGKDSLVFSSDEFFMKDGQYIFNAKLLGEAHRWNQNRVEKAMQNNNKLIVVDNTNTKMYEMKPYIQLANKYNYKVEFIQPNWNKEMYTKDGKWNFDFLKNKSIHNVPEEKIRSMIDGFDYNPTIENILKSKAPWEK